jgi:hypothetical protein
LSAADKERLYELLRLKDEQLVTSILEALGRAGGGRAVRPVERLTKRGRTERVRGKAAEILPVLQQRQRAEQAPQVLLRAAEPVPESPDELLRAASAEADVDPSTLLRAEIPGELPP